MMTDEEFLKKFWRQDFDQHTWDHEAHVRLGWLLLNQYPLFDEALNQVRTGIKKLNDVIGVAKIGYHETITRAYLILIKYKMKAGETFQDFKASNTELFGHGMAALSPHYSKERLLSPEAKAKFIVPDLETYPFCMQPTIAGKLLSIRPLIEKDFDGLFNVASDPQIWDQHPFPRYMRPDFEDYFKGAIDSQSGVMVLDQKSGSVIGTSRYYNITENAVSIGYTFLARRYWGGTYNSELKKLMVGYALQFVPEVFFDIGETNYRSRRAIEKIGAEFVGMQMIRGKPYTLYKMDKAIFKRNLKGF